MIAANMRPSPIPVWIRLLLLSAAAGMIGGLFIVGAQPVAVGFFQPPVDKVAHGGVFALLAILLWYGSNRQSALGVFVVVVLVGALDEWHQRYLPGRSADLLDLAADAIEAGVVLMVFRAIREKSSRQR